MIHYLSCVSSKVVDEQLYGQFALGYFIPGQTLTVANTLRRGLLSQVPGISISCVYIHKAQHEYQSLVGVKECVLDLLLRLKQIVIKGPEKISPIVVFLNVQGPGVVRAKHLQLPYFLQCVHPEEIIATLNEKGHLRLKCLIVSGTGYLNLGHQPTLYKKHRRILQQGHKNRKCFPVDGVFSPVVKVNYTIETANNQSELALVEIWTNGTVSPRNAIHRAVRAIIELFLPWQNRKEATEYNPNKTNQYDKPKLRLNLTKKYPKLKPGYNKMLRTSKQSWQKSVPVWKTNPPKGNVQDQGLNAERSIYAKLQEIRRLQKGVHSLHKKAAQELFRWDYVVQPQFITLDPIFDQMPSPNQRRLQLREHYDYQAQVQDLLMRQIPVLESKGCLPNMTPFNVSVFLGEHLHLRYDHIYQAKIERLVPKFLQDLTCDKNRVKTPAIIDKYSRKSPKKYAMTFDMDIDHIRYDQTIYKQLKRWSVNTVEQLRWLQPKDLFQMSFTFDQIEVIRREVVRWTYEYNKP